MSIRYTNHEWETFIKQTESIIDVSTEPYLTPEIGSPAFLKTIDHTLLKLEARNVQFDELCAEARVDGFAVSQHPCSTRFSKLTEVVDGLRSTSLRSAVQI